MLESFRTWLAEKLRPSPAPTVRTSSRVDELAARYAVAVESFNLQQKANMVIQADLLRQLSDVVGKLELTFQRLAAQDAAAKQQLAELQAENQRLRDAAASGEASSVELAAVIAKLNALMTPPPAGTGAAVEGTA